MRFERRADRTKIDIPVAVNTVLETLEGAIADLSEFGALIHGCAVEPGARVRIDYLGQTNFAQCRWAEIDRMGIEFLFPLTRGPLYERLLMMRAMPADEEGAPAFLPTPARLSAGLVRRFGKRG